MTADRPDVRPDPRERHNRVPVNVLCTWPPGGLAARALPGHPTVAQRLTLVGSVRLLVVVAAAPDVIARALEDRPAAVRDAV